MKLIWRYRTRYNLQLDYLGLDRLGPVFGSRPLPPRNPTQSGCKVPQSSLGTNSRQKSQMANKRTRNSPNTNDPVTPTPVTTPRTPTAAASSATSLSELSIKSVSFVSLLIFDKLHLIFPSSVSTLNFLCKGLVIWLVAVSGTGKGFSCRRIWIHRVNLKRCSFFVITHLEFHCLKDSK